MFITLILALVLGDSLKKSFTSSSQGFSFLSTTLTVLGFILLAVYALSLISKSLKWITLSTLPVMLAIIAVAIFALVVSSKGAGVKPRGLTSRPYSYRDYYLGNYTKWMQHKVNDPSDWQTYYRKVISSQNVCSDLTDVHQSDSEEHFYQIKLSSLQSGCCKPLEECNFTYVNPTNWTKPEKVNKYSNNTDCSTWSNDQSSLCYNCDSCKAGYVQDVKKQWFTAGMVICIIATLELAVYVILTCMCWDPDS